MSFTDTHSRTLSQEAGDAFAGGYDQPTVDCYRRRSKILSSTQRTEWWMAVAVMLVVAFVGIVLL